MPSHPVHPPEWIDSAPTLIEQSIDIVAPPAAAWRIIADHERWPEWFVALEKVERIGSGDGVGGQRRVTIAGPPVDEEFTAWTPNERFAFAITSSKIPILRAVAEDVQVAATEDGCRLTYRQGIEMRRGFGWLAQAISGRISEQLGAALVELKSRAESDA